MNGFLSLWLMSHKAIHNSINSIHHSFFAPIYWICHMYCMPTLKGTNVPSNECTPNFVVSYNTSFSDFWLLIPIDFLLDLLLLIAFLLCLLVWLVGVHLNLKDGLAFLNKTYNTKKIFLCVHIDNLGFVGLRSFAWILSAALSPQRVSLG